MKKMNGKPISIDIESEGMSDFSRGLSGIVGKKCNEFFVKKNMTTNTFRDQISMSAQSKLRMKAKATKESKTSKKKK